MRRRVQCFLKPLAGAVAAIHQIDRIADDKSFEFDSRGRHILRAGQWKLCRCGRDIEIEQVMDAVGEKGALVRYRRGEPTEMLRPVFWRLGFIQIGVLAPWKRPRADGAISNAPS